MHYRNGREAKNGDVVLFQPSYPAGAIPVIGILYNAIAGNDSCNGRLAIPQMNDPYPKLAECLHVDDAIAKWPASTASVVLQATAGAVISETALPTTR